MCLTKATELIADKATAHKTKTQRKDVMCFCSVCLQCLKDSLEMLNRCTCGRENSEGWRSEKSLRARHPSRIVKNSHALGNSTAISAVKWTKLSDDSETRSTFMAGIRATHYDTRYWQLTARSNTSQSSLSVCLCASLFRCTAQFPNQQ